ncbi:hypothetical protein [Methanococcoides burtonii]|nr:hypothetical protein [Methanococcoides burtonii]
MIQKPLAVDNTYKIRDNQLWYNDCNFFEMVENKATIEVNIEGLGIRTVTHSAIGKDGRPTFSYKLPSREDRKWWETHRGEFVKLELLSIEGKS